MAKRITSEEDQSFQSFEAVVIDDEAKFIRNVVLCGNESKNGYSYPATCFKSLDHVVSLYEGRPVCINHNLNNPGVRDVRDIAGFIRNVRFEAGKPMGDIEVESAIDCGVDLMALAKKGRRGIGMSHTARCKMSRDKKTVELVEAVITVDVVVNPATTTTFFEQEQEQDMELEQLKADLETVKSENAVLKHELDSAKTLAESHKVESNKLLAEVTTLRADLQDIKPKLEQYEQAAKVEADKLAIEAQLVSAGLDIKDTVVVSEQFMAVLLSANPDNRTKIIDDRKAVITGAGKAGAVSLPRQVKTEQEMVPGQRLKKLFNKEAN